MIRTQIYLPEKLNTDLKIFARRQGQTMAALVRSFLLEKFQDIKKKQKSTTHILLQIAGKGGRGPKNLSTKIDEYLYGRQSL